MFFDQAPIQIGKMQEHLKEEDASRLELQAHSLKGAAMYIAAKNHELERAVILLGSIEGELGKFKKAVTAAGLKDG